MKKNKKQNETNPEEEKERKENTIAIQRGQSEASQGRNDSSGGPPGGSPPIHPFPMVKLNLC